MPLAGTLLGVRQRLTSLAVAALAVLTPTATAATAGGGAAVEPRPAVRREALSAMRCAQQHGIGLDATRLAVIDYTLSSRQPRLWVLDLERDVVLFEEHVAHGQGSGFDVPMAFSDRHGSRQSSLGLFLTGSTYIGNNGYSLRLVGLSRGFNESAADRLIVIHGADYVNPPAAAQVGRLGRSWGCPVVRKAVTAPIIDALRGGQFVYAFGPGTPRLAECRPGDLVVPGPPARSGRGDSRERQPGVHP